MISISCHYDNPAFIDPQVPLPFTAPTIITPVTLTYATVATAPEPELGWVSVSPPPESVYKIVLDVNAEVLISLNTPDITITPLAPSAIAVCAKPATGKVLISSASHLETSGLFSTESYPLK